MIALLALPQWRGRLALGLTVSTRRLAHGRGAWHAARARGLAHGRDRLGPVAHEAVWHLAQFRRRAPWVVAALALLLSVPALTLLLRHHHAYDGYDDTASVPVNPQVAALLTGEHLIPPAALPPELFLSREVEQAHPLAATASREWLLLDEEFRQRLLRVFKTMRERHGYEMVLIEGYRSPQRQAQLAALGGSVTRAGPGQSWHQFGLAADCAFLRNGRIVIAETDPWAAEGYARYGEVARSLGLTWGGGWRSIKDFGHIEMRRNGRAAPDATALASPAPRRS